MNNDNDAKNFIAVMAPLALVLAPIFWAVIIYKLIQDRINGLPTQLMDPGLWVIILSSVAGVWFTIDYGKKELGWFKKKE